jgi:hypothetical protein
MGKALYACAVCSQDFTKTDWGETQEGSGPQDGRDSSSARLHYWEVSR